MIIKKIRIKTQCIGPLALIMSNALWADSSTQNDTTCTNDCPKTIHYSWMDKGHASIDKGADSLAIWLDSFFGTPSSDIENANTALRLQLNNHWEENEGVETKVRLRGKLHLPRLSKRLSLVFLDEDENDTDNDIAKEAVDEERNSTDVALQYNAKETKRSRLDIKLSVRSDFEPKISARYRYNYPFWDYYKVEFTETVFYRTDDGFGSTTRVRLDRTLSSNKLLSWSNRAKVSEDFDGTRWSSTLSLAKRLTNDRALSYVVGASGETKPDRLTTRYGVSVVYRQKIFRPWLFVELEPAYQWDKSDVDDHREGNAMFTLRLEAKFETTPKYKK